MPVEFICDGCSKREPGYFVSGNWQKPGRWFQRSDEDGAQLACGRACIEKISQKTGKTGMVLPV